VSAELVALIVLLLLIGWLGIVLGATWVQLRDESAAERARRRGWR
jgi:hypothetical protein